MRGSAATLPTTAPLLAPDGGRPVRRASHRPIVRGCPSPGSGADEHRRRRGDAERAGMRGNRRWLGATTRLHGNAEKGGAAIGRGLWRSPRRIVILPSPSAPVNSSRTQAACLRSRLALPCRPRITQTGQSPAAPTGSVVYGRFERSQRSPPARTMSAREGCPASSASLLAARDRLPSQPAISRTGTCDTP